MSDIEKWLQQHGLEEHVSIFHEQQVRVSDLPLLTEEDILELGLPLGPRKRLLAAIDKLGHAVSKSEDSVEATVSPDWSAAERRQITVVFCDLVGSTELSRKLDPEDMQNINRAYQDTCKNIIDRYEGYIARYMGDGVLAYFGYPKAHEDDAVRAVHAGLDIVAEMPSLNERVAGELDAKLTVRVGIATGPVVVGDVVGEGASQESTATGETPNFAARLQGLAKPNSVVIGAETRRLAMAHFEYQEITNQKIKGFAEPITVWRVLGERVVRRFEAHHPSEIASLVGRNEELALILRRWKQAKEGEGQAVLLSGEPGIGKSRVVEAFRRKLSHEDCVFLSYQCSAYHTNTVLWPVIEQLERAAEIHSDDKADKRLGKLKTLLSLSAIDVERSIPYIASLLSIDTGGCYSLPSLSPQELKESTLECLVQHVVGLAGNQPVVMLYEDAHWSDPTSLELIESIIQQLSNLPLLLLITFRPEFSSRWGEFDNVTGLTLNRLSRSEIHSLALEISGGKRLPDEILEEILKRTDGVPLYVEELTKFILESDVLTETQDGYILSAPLPALEIPMTLKGSLMARLDRLGAARETAQVAAVIGRQFIYELLAAISLVSRDDLLEALNDLSASGLLMHKGYPPNIEYTFKHALVRDVAYESLLKSRRFALHGALAETLEKRHADNLDEVCESIAYHYSQANQPAKAVEYLVKSAEKAAKRYSHREAIETLSLALDQSVHLDDESAAVKKADLQLRLAHSHYFIGNFKESIDIVSDERNQMRLVSGTKLAAEWYFWLGHMGIRFGNPELAKNAAEHAIQEAESANAVGAMGRALGVLVIYGHFYDSADELRASVEHAARSGSLLEETGEFYWQGMTEFYAGMVHITLGDFDSALRAADNVRAIGDRTEDKRLQAYGGFLYGWIRATLRQFELAAKTLERALEIAPDPTSKAYVSAFLGYVYMETGEHRLATPLLRKAVKDFVAFQFRPFEGWFRVLLAESLRQEGEIEEALVFATAGMDITREVRYAYGIGWAQRCLGRLGDDSGNQEKVETYLRAAIATFEGLGARYELARSLEELAKVMMKRGSSAEAESLNEISKNLYGDVGITS